jgi:hypothetical protein
MTKRVCSACRALVDHCERIGRRVAEVERRDTFARILTVDRLCNVLPRFGRNHLEREDTEGLFNVEPDLVDACVACARVHTCTARGGDRCDRAQVASTRGYEVLCAGPAGKAEWGQWRMGARGATSTQTPNAALRAIGGRGAPKRSRHVKQVTGMTVAPSCGAVRKGSAVSQMTRKREVARV